MKDRTMKQNEIEYLDKLFASTSDITEEAEVDVPLVEVPEGLDRRLKAIADSTVMSTRPIKQTWLASWPKAAGVAASLFVAVVVFQFYQQQQTLKQLEQAQADLKTALHYLGEANRITQAQVASSINQNMKKAAIEPAIEIGRETVVPSLKSIEEKSRRQSL